MKLKITLEHDSVATNIGQRRVHAPHATYYTDIKMEDHTCVENGKYVTLVNEL